MLGAWNKPNEISNLHARRRR
uniref:Uncharacterized protein n=1 Tax=Anopheles quadriannulatus TaxID=34691 RepID=A0A182XU32_ANOQN